MRGARPGSLSTLSQRRRRVRRRHRVDSIQYWLLTGLWALVVLIVLTLGVALSTQQP